jgi:hypothetical protein
MKNFKRLIASFVVVLTFLAITPLAAHAEWRKSGNGWWYAEGGSYAIGWDKIDGNWYYFNSNGYMKTGWIKYNDTWYYLSDSGAIDDSMTTKTMPTQKYTYDECEGIADAWFNNTHASGYKYSVTSDKKLYDNGDYYFSIYSSITGKLVGLIGVSVITGEIIE